MNNFHENIPFSLSYADLSQAQTIDSAVLHNPQLQNSALQHAHLQDPTAYQNLSTSYAPFPILPAAIQPPQLYQPTIDVAKNVNDHAVSVNNNKSKPKASSQDVSTDAPPPVRVIRPPNAYLLFNKELRKHLKESNPTLKVAEISKEISERWKKLSKTEKERYVTEANNIKEAQRAMHPNSMYIRRSKMELARAGHYEKKRRKALAAQQQQNSSTTDNSSRKSTPGSSGEGGCLVDGTTNSDGSSKQPTRRKRQRRDKNPAAPKHPLSAYMWFLTEVRPETMQTYPGSTVGQISKLCADRWNTMTEEERMPWHTKAQADKARYAREMQIYAAQHDQPMGRGTRQKYRAAAAAATAAAVAAAAAAAASASSSSSSNTATRILSSTAAPSSSSSSSPISVPSANDPNKLLLSSSNDQPQLSPIPDNSINRDHSVDQQSLSVPNSPSAILHSSPLPAMSSVPDEIPAAADVAAIFAATPHMARRG